MGSQSLALLTLSVKATADVREKRFVSTAGEEAGTGADIYGASLTQAAAGNIFPVVNQGTAIVEAGGAIAEGAKVESDAQGRAVTNAGGTVAGRLAPGQSAGAAGDLVEVILFNN